MVDCWKKSINQINLMDIQILKNESNFFNMKTASAVIKNIEDISHILKFVDVNKIKFLILKCSKNKKNIINELKNNNFIYIESQLKLNYNNICYKNIPSFHVENIKIRIPKKTDDIFNLVKTIFDGYESHYHKNIVLDKSACDNIYPAWAVQTLHDNNNYFRIIEQSKSLVAFSCGRKISNVFNGELLGVVSNKRNNGIAKYLNFHRLNWCKNNNINSITTSISSENLIYKNLLLDIGYNIIDIEYTFHLCQQ
jgi:hypothetical protein